MTRGLRIRARRRPGAASNQKRPHEGEETGFRFDADVLRLAPIVSVSVKTGHRIWCEFGPFVIFYRRFQRLLKVPNIGLPERPNSKKDSCSSA